MLACKTAYCDRQYAVLFARTQAICSALSVVLWDKPTSEMVGAASPTKPGVAATAPSVSEKVSLADRPAVSVAFTVMMADSVWWPRVAVKLSLWR